MRVRFIIVPACILAVWFLTTELELVHAVLLPSPIAVFVRLFSLVTSGEVLPDLGASLWRLVLGFGLAMVLGVLMGMLMGSYRGFREAMEFPVDSFRSVPATALFPLFMLVLGVGSKSNVALIAFPCIWIMTINTMYGVRNSSRVRRQIAQVFRATRAQQFVTVTFPDALPYIATGLRLCVAVALHMAIVAEMFTGTTSGLGRRIFDAHMLLRVPEMYALILLAGLVGYLLNVGWLAIERRLVHWADR